MAYRNLPYSARYLVALTAWAVAIIGDVFLRIAFVIVLPFAAVATGLFNKSQAGAQMGADLVGFYTRPLMRMPRAHWSLILGRRNGDAAKPKAIK